MPEDKFEESLLEVEKEIINNNLIKIIFPRLDEFTKKYHELKTHLKDEDKLDVRLEVIEQGPNYLLGYPELNVYFHEKNKMIKKILTYSSHSVDYLIFNDDLKKYFEKL